MSGPMKRRSVDGVAAQAIMVFTSELSCSDAKVHTCHSLFS
jgi:hypothetical protein